VLRNVKLSGKTGLTIGWANVTGKDVTVTAEQGQGIVKLDDANVTLQ